MSELYESISRGGVNERCYYSEDIAGHTQVRYTVRQTLYKGHSGHQQVDILKLANLGNSLFLDGVLQTAELDEFLYHESLVHPAMLTHQEARRVLIVGGGDGGALRETLKHSTVKQTVVVELDAAVVQLSEQWLPQISAGAFSDERNELRIGDARHVIADYRNHFDVIILDLTDPREEGVSSLLFTQEFYSLVSQALTPQGVLLTQAGDASPGKGWLLADLCATLSTLAPHVRSFLCPVPSFQGIWSFVLASWGDDPKAKGVSGWHHRLGQLSERLCYLTPEQLRAGLAIPPYLETTFKQGTIRTDAAPYIWPE